MKLKTAKLGVALALIGSVILPVAASATTLFTAPGATSTFTSIATWSSEGFDSFLPITYIIVGLAFGAMLVGVVIRALMRAGKRVFNGGRRGGRRRR